MAPDQIVVAAGYQATTLFCEQGSQQIEAFGRKVTTTANHLMSPLGDPSSNAHYQHAMSGLQKELLRPGIQQRVFSYAKASPTELVRSKLSTSEIQHRALTFLPDDILRNLPESENTYSLFQGFQATIPELDEDDDEHKSKGHRRLPSKPQNLLERGEQAPNEPPSLTKLRRDRDKANHRLEMMSIRKNMCSAEIWEIENKISNLNSMRKIVLERLGDIEQDEIQAEQGLLELDNQIEEMVEDLDDATALGNPVTPATEIDPEGSASDHEVQVMNESFMSASIYNKLPSPRSSRRQKPARRKSIPIRHEHFEPGSNIRELQAHNDMITALDFDVPFGTMVTSALDDTVRVWDLNLGRCIGLLEGHHASVRCLQVEDSIVATGSMDASIRLWDLSKADYAPQENRFTKDDQDTEEDNVKDDPPLPHPSSMQDCPLFSLEAHVDEVTALHFRGDTLVSGSADKTLRQWDLVKGRCVQTLDVLWAAAQASATMNTSDGQWRATGRLPDASADFVGALQCFDAALACGTADGMVRLWDLRSGQVHRSLVGHTGPVTCVQFDDVHLVTGSLDRSIRIWDLRTGSIYDAYAYDNPVTSMMFDSRRIVAAAGENVVKIYDKPDGRHWDCGAGLVAEEDGQRPAVVEKVNFKDGFLTEGRKDGAATCAAKSSRKHQPRIKPGVALNPDRFVKKYLEISSRPAALSLLTMETKEGSAFANTSVELVSQILENLPRSDLAQCRLVCKNFLRCSIGVFRIKTLYISPHEKDMEVFDCVTKHPNLYRTITHIVYDAAQFPNYSLKSYLKVIRRQFKDENFTRLHASNPTVQVLARLASGPESDHSGRTWYHGLVSSSGGNHASILFDGHQLYSQLARDQKNLFRKSWFERARQGLERIRHIDSVAIQNTWDMLFHAHDSLMRLDQSDDRALMLKDDEGIDHDTLYFAGQDDNSEGVGQGNDHGGIIDLRQEKQMESTLMLLDHPGTYKGKSPLARSWPPTNLLPMARGLPWVDPTVKKLRDDFILDGSFEFLKVIELLRSARQRPLEIVFPGDWRHGSGLSPIVFETRWPESTYLPAVCHRLQRLEIQIAAYEVDWKTDEFPSLDRLPDFFQTTLTLQSLSLKMPFNDSQWSSHRDLYDYSHVFPSATEWSCPTLKNLEIWGMSASYRDLASLLFLNFRNVRCLRLAYIELGDGAWEDIVEGLRHFDKVRTCEIKEPLLYTDDRWFAECGVKDDRDEVVEGDWKSDNHYAFLAALSQYITEGGRHPSLSGDEGNERSGKYMERLDETLSEVRAVHKEQ